MHITQAQQRGIVGFPGLGPHRVPEEQQHIHFPAADHGRDLLGASAAARVQAAHRQPRCIMDDFAGYTGSHQLILRQDADIGRAKLCHQFLAGIVGDQSDSHDEYSLPLGAHHGPKTKISFI